MPDARPPLRRQVASTLRRMPWLTRLLLGLYRCTRARFTSGVVGAVFNNCGELLIVEHVFHQVPWGLPGGWLERREAPVDGLLRELREELGLVITVLEPLIIQPSDMHPAHLDIAFLCRAEGDVQSLSPELLDFRWIRLESLPPMAPFHREAIEAAKVRRQLRGFDG